MQLREELKYVFIVEKLISFSLHTKVNETDSLQPSGCNEPSVS